MKRPWILLLAPGVAGCVLWLLLTTGETPRGKTTVAHETPAAPAPTPATAELARASAPEPEAQTPPSAPAPAPREALSTPLSDELARAHWVEGRVLFPDGTPPDEELFIVANGKDFAEGSDHRAKVERDGSFHVAFSEKSRSGWFSLEGRYLYLGENARWKREQAEPIVLEPQLGARILGRVILPVGLEAAAAEGQIQLNARLQGRRQLSEQQKGSVPVTSELSFSFDALPIDASYGITHDGKRLVGATGVLGLKPGETRQIALELRAGITLAGLVKDESGAPLADITVFAGSRRPSGPWGGGRHRGMSTLEDGSFSLGALEAGQIEIQVFGDGFLPAQLDLGELEEGTARTNLELVLERGLAIEGVVRWPDGSPAEATLQLEPHRALLEWDDALRPVQGIGSADGRFHIGGLARTAYRVQAHATRTEEVTVKSEITGKERKRKERTQWGAEIERVEAGTSGLVLTLSTGLALAGRVLDDLGVPVPSFRVRAQPSRADESRVFFPEDGLNKSFRNTDGSFLMEGFMPGGWELVASASDHGDSGVVRVTIPVAGPVDLVLPREAIVSGVVIDARGNPLPGVEVEAGQEDARRFDDLEHDTTDAEGAFRLGRMRPGTSAIQALAPEYAPARTMVELVAGQELTGIVLRLGTGATILGEVLGAGGRPEAGVSVHVSGLDGSIETDAAGRFEAHGVEPGRVRLFASTSDGLNLQQTVDVAEGETVRVRLAPPEGGIVHLRGHVRVGGEPRAELSVHASRLRAEGEEPSFSSSSCETDAEGAYELTLPGPGRYLLALNAGFGSLSWRTNLEVPATDSFVHDVDVPVGRISGRVTDTSGAPLAEVMVRSEPEQHDNGSHGSARALTDAEGHYELELPGGRHAVLAGGKDSRWPGSQGANYAEARVGGLVLGAKDHLRNVDLVLARGGTLEGVVRLADGSGASHVNLWSYPEGAPKRLGWSGEDGTFRIEGLAPGTHWIGATGEGWATAERTRVEIEAGTTRRVELALVRATSLHVVVRDASGTQVGCEIEVADSTGRRQALQTGEKGGEAWAGPLPPGGYTVRARREDKLAEQAIELSGEEGRRELALTFD